MRPRTIVTAGLSKSQDVDDGATVGPRDDVHALSRSLRTRREHSKLGRPSLARRMFCVSDKVDRMGGKTKA